MIISEKQINMLIDIAYKFAIFLHTNGNHEVANGVEDFLEKITLQQSEELKEIT